ncbi:hypothetical protein D3C85_1335470 [compost metagenome]
MRKVALITRLMLMPISPATSWFCAVARMALPSRVLSTSRHRPSMITTAISMIDSCTLVMVAPNTSTGWVSTTSGKVL